MPTKNKMLMLCFIALATNGHTKNATKQVPLPSFLKQPNIEGLPAIGMNHILKALADSMLVNSAQTSDVTWQLRYLTKKIYGFFKECVKKNIVTSDNNTFFAPCKLFAYEQYTKQYNIKKTWYVSVHHNYAINMTIIEGYVPYTTGCNPHSITLYSRFFSHKTPMNTHCGHVENEQHYSYSSISYIQLLATKAHLYCHISLSLAYEVIIRGSAYRFLISSFPPDMEVHVVYTPSWVLFFEGRLKYVWYLANNIQFTNSSGTLTILNSQDYASNGTETIVSMLRISTYFKRCSDPTSSVAVYTGLLTWFLMKWKANPLCTVICDKMLSQNISIVIPHWYATVLLDISNLAIYLDVKIDFVVAQKSLTQNITLKTSSAYLSYVSHSQTSHLLFSAFDVSGHQHTVSYQQIRRSVSQYGIFKKAGTNLSHISSYHS